MSDSITSALAETSYVLFLGACALAVVAVIVRLIAGYQVLSFVGGLVCIAGGLWLISAKAVGENSLFELLSHGIGIYCLGRGIAELGRPWKGAAPTA